jgi:hypothetical protein
MLPQVIWHYRSGINNKQPLKRPEQMKHEDLKRLLEPLWRASAGPLDEWSRTFIRKRFY